jgi:hypothetical protein
MFRGIFTPLAELVSNTVDKISGWLQHGLGRQLFDDASSSDIADLLHQEGLDFDASQVDEISRAIQDEIVYSELVKDIDKDYFVPQGRWDYNHKMKLSSNLVYRFKVEGMNYYTGEEDDTYFSLGSNRELTLQEAEDALLSLLAGQDEFYGISVETMELDIVMSSPGFTGSR